MTEKAPSIHDLRRRLSTADDWMTYASYTAMISAGLGALAVVMSLLRGEASGAEAAAIISSLASLGLVGFKLRSRSVWAAWGLAVFYVTSIVVSLFVWSIWTGIILKLGVAYVYVRGLLSALDYEELSAAIKAHHAAQAAPRVDAV